MSDPKQPIYNALNWLSSVMPCKPPDDNELIIEAYDKLYSIQDEATRKAFLGVIQRLRFRNSTIENVLKAWGRSTDELRAACQLIDKKAAK